MPTETFTTILDIQTANSARAVDALARSEKRLADASKALEKQITAQNRAAAKTEQAARKSARATEDARAKLDRAVRQQRAAIEIAERYGVSMKAAGRAVRAFGDDTKRARREGITYARQLDEMDRKAKELAASQRAAAGGSKSLSVSLAGLQGAVGVLVGSAGLAALIHQIQQSVQAFISMEAVIRSLNVATGGTAQGADALAFVRAEADRLGLSLQTTSGEFGKLNAAAIGTTLQGEGVRNIFSAVSEASSVLGLSSDQTSGALTALGQIMSKGTVQAEELRGQLGERIPGAFQIMARGLGVTTQELGKMLERGEVLAEDALPAFAAELRRAFGTDATTRIETTAATFARLETAIFDLRSEIGRLSVERGGLGDIVDNLSQMIQVATNTIRVVDDFAGSVDVLGDRFQLFNDKALRLANKGLKSMLGTASEAGGKMAPAIEATERYAKETEQSVSWADQMKKALDEVVEGMDEAEKKTKELEKAQKAAFDPLSSRLEQLRLTAQIMKEFGVGAADAGEAARVQLTSGMDDAADQAIELQREIREAEQALVDLQAAAGAEMALRLGQAPGQLEEIDFDPFAALDEPFKRGATLAIDVAKGVREIFDETESARLEAERLDEQWVAVGETALSVADAIGGSFGDMLGGLIDGVLGVRDAFKGVQAAQGGGMGGTLMAGFGLGQQAGGVVSGLGLSLGQGTAGGLLSGIGGALGSLAGPVGGLIGGVVGELVGSLNIFQEGGDTATAAFEVNAGRLEAVTTKLEGDLGQGIETFSGVVAKSINAILASLGAFVGPGGLADIDVKIRQEGDETLFQVRRFGRTFAKFKDEASAVTAAIQTILAESDIQGLSENVAAAIRNTTATTFDQLAADIARAQLVDERLMTEGERFRESRIRFMREEINALADLGVNMGDVIEGLIRMEEALARQAELQALSIAGVDTSLEQSLAALDVLAEQADQAAALNAAYQAAAEGATAAAQAEIELGRDRAEAFGDLEGFRGALPGLGRDFRDVEERAVAAGDAAGVAAREIDGVDAALVEMAREATVARGLASFVGRVAELTGNAELAAQAAELQRQAQLITIRLEFERIKVLGILDEALQASIEAAIQQAEELGAAVDAAGPGPVRRGAGVGGRRQRRKAAAESFRDAVDDIQARLSGTHPELLAMADATEKLREQIKEGKIGAEEAAAAMSALAELQRRELADLGQQGLANLGGVAAQVRGETAAAAAEIGFLLGNLELLGLTVRDVRVAVRQGLAPALLSIAEAEARRVGDLRAAEEIAQRRAHFERMFERLRFEGLVAQLELAGALSPALREVAEQTRGFFDLPDAVAGVVEETAAAVAELGSNVLTSFFSIAESEAQRAVDATVEGTQAREDAEKHLADVQRQRAELERNLARLRFEALIVELELAGRLTPELRALADTTLDLFDSAAVGVEGLRVAVDDFGDAAEEAIIIMGGMSVPGTLDFDELEALADIIDELTRADMTPLERALAAYEDTMARIAAATGTAAERAEAIALAEAELARARSEIFEDQISGLRALDAEVSEAILRRQAPRQQVISARGEFESALATLDLGDQSSIDRFTAAATNWRQVVANYDASLQSFGGSGAALVSSVDRIIAEALAAVLPPAPPGVDPLDLGTVPPLPAPGASPSGVPPPTPAPAPTFDSSSIVSAIGTLQGSVDSLGARVDAQTVAMTTWHAFLTPTVGDVGAASRTITSEFGT